MIKKLYNYVKSFDKKIKFLFVGGLNTLIGYGVSTLMLYLVFKIPFNAKAQADELQLLASSFTGHIAGMVNAYFWNKYFTFECSEKSFKQVIRFCIVGFLQLALSYGMQLLFQNVLGLGIYVAQPVTIVITTVFSYIGHNYFTFIKDGSHTNKNTTDTKE